MLSCAKVQVKSLLNSEGKFYQPLVGKWYICMQFTKCEILLAYGMNSVALYKNMASCYTRVTPLALWSVRHMV